MVQFITSFLSLFYKFTVIFTFESGCLMIEYVRHLNSLFVKDFSHDCA
jgi:hypothetical protein